jgi:sirohydrochlorin ferrochelatase
MKSGDPNDLDRLGSALQASLRPVDPGAPFTAALQARLASGDSHSIHIGNVPSVHHRRLHRASLALAASAVMALAVGWQLRSVRNSPSTTPSGLESSRIQMQILTALEITSERLGLAQQRIEQYQSQEKGL